MLELESALDIVLRGVGAFYAVTAPIVLKSAAMGRFLTRMLSSLSEVDPRETRAETIRVWYLSANAVLIGAGGILLMAGAAAAAPVFIVAALSYGLYLFVIAPRYLDPYDPPEEPGRSQTRNAFFVFLAATALVWGGYSSGVLTPAHAVSPVVFSIAAALIVALAVYGLHQLAPWKAEPRAGADADEAIPVDDDDFDVEEYKRGFPLSTNVVLTPSWARGGLVDAVTGEPCHGIADAEISEEEYRRISEWISLFRSLADANDPLRRALREPSDQGRIEEAGRPVYRMLVDKLGPDRVAFEPVARPCEPEIAVAGVKVMADYSSSPLWHAGGEEAGNISPEALGLSWALSQDLESWSLDYEQSLDWNDPGGPPRWSAKQFAAHDRRGRALTERVKDELRRTGRQGVTVEFVPQATDVGASPGA